MFYPRDNTRTPFHTSVSTSGRTGLLHKGKNPKVAEVFLNRDATPEEVIAAFDTARRKMMEALK